MRRIISCTLASLVGALALMIVPTSSFAGNGTGTPVPEGFGWRDGQYAGPGYSGCQDLFETTGIKVPVYTPYYGTPSAYPNEEAFAEAEFEIARQGCRDAVWVTVHYKEPNPRYNVVIDTKRLYSSKFAETSIAQVADEPAPLYGDELDGREGCIQAMVYVDGAHFLGRSSPAATMQWGECVPPWLREPAPGTPQTESKGSQPEQPKGGTGTAYHESHLVTKPKAKPHRKKRVCRKHGRRMVCKKAKKAHHRPGGDVVVRHEE